MSCGHIHQVQVSPNRAPCVCWCEDCGAFRIFPQEWKLPKAPKPNESYYAVYDGKISQLFSSIEPCKRFVEGIAPPSNWAIYDFNREALILRGSNRSESEIP